MKRFENMVAVVTGAADGQGKAEAMLFAREGANVVITDIQGELLEKTADEIRNTTGAGVLSVTVDSASEDGWAQLVKDAVAKFGKINILVNNAGIRPMGTVEEFDIEVFNRTMDVDVVGLALGMKYCIPEMKKSGYGAIVNTSSVYGPSFGAGNFISYCTAKSAVVGLTKAAVVDLDGTGIRVNTLHPGFIISPMTIGRPQEIKDKFLSRTPVGRHGTCEDIAEAVAFLCSDKAGFINGVSLFVDGGLSVKF